MDKYVDDDYDNVGINDDNDKHDDDNNAVKDSNAAGDDDDESDCEEHCGNVHDYFIDYK